MSRQWLYFLILGLVFLSSPVKGGHAHGGHKKKTAETPASLNSIYAVEEEETSSRREDVFSLSRTDALSGEIPTLPKPVKRMDHDAGGAGDHKTPEVEIARREWISPKKKGYGMAAGITVFAGLIFAALHFKRPNQ